MNRFSKIYLNTFCYNFLVVNNFIKSFIYLKTKIINKIKNISTKPIKPTYKYIYNFKYTMNWVRFGLIDFFTLKTEQSRIYFGLI